MAAGSASHASPGTAPAAPDPSVDGIIDRGVKALKNLSPAVGETLEIALKSALIPDTDQTRAQVQSFLIAACNCAKGTNEINAKVTEIDSAVYPTSKKIDKYDTEINKLITAARSTPALMEQAMMALSAADSSIDLTDFRTALTSLDGALSTAISDKDVRLTDIQAKLLERQNGPARISAFPSIYDGSFDTAPVNVGTVGGVSLDLYKKDGFAFAKMTTSTGTVIEYKLDAESIAGNASVKGSQAERVLEVNSRVQGRLHEVLKAWQATAAAGATGEFDPALLGAEEGYGAVGRSAVGKAFFESGAKISLLANGRFHDQNIIGLDLSGAVLDNFKITYCWAHNMSLAGATLKNGTIIYDNDMQNANCARLKVESLPKGSRGRVCEFNNNDLHGTDGSLMNADFGDAKVHYNNFLGVNMNGMRSDTMRNVKAADSGGVRFFSAAADARAAFKAQFQGSNFLLDQMKNDPPARQVFEVNSTGVADPKALAKLNGDISHDDMMKILGAPAAGLRDERNPLLMGQMNVANVAAAGGMQAGTKVTVESTDRSKKAEGHFDQGMRHGYMATNGEPLLMGNLELLNQLLKVAAVNRNGSTPTSSGLGSMPLNFGARVII